MVNNKQQGFTLIELIMVIVILGILAAVALPRFVNLSGEAHEATADAVLGAANSAAAINYAAVAVGQAGATIITADAAGATKLRGLIDVDGAWTATGATLTATLGGTAHIITVSTAETATAKAVLTESW